MTEVLSDRIALDCRFHGRCVGGVVSCVCMRSERKTAVAISTKVDRDVVLDRP